MAITDIDWGTVTLTNGSTTVTGSGTSWIADDIRDGDTFVFVDGGDGFQQPIVASVQSNTELTLRNDWEGPTLTATAYTLRYQWDSSRVSAMSRRLIMLLESGNLEALAGLTGPGVAVFNGPHSMEVRPFTDFVNGVTFDVQVDTLADRDAYDGQVEGFTVLVSDMGDGRSAIFTKNSNTVADWSDAAYITGPVGDTGPYTDITVGPVTTLPYGQPASVDVVQVDPETIRLDFSIPKGQDGTGTGDMVGPSSSTVNGFVGFADTGGKQTKQLTSAQATAGLDVFDVSLKGLVPAPSSSDISSGKLLRADSTWVEVGGGSGAFTLPSGTTAQRPSVPEDGMIRYNTTLDLYEVYSNSTWSEILTSPYQYQISYLVVGGGGGDGFGNGGGGGAGGLRSGTMTLTKGESLVITVGSGGAGSLTDGAGSNGNDSSIGSLIIATGGGGGGGAGAANGKNGGSGGGGGDGGTGGTGVSGQGNNGGSSPAAAIPGGGGGGAGAVGTNGVTSDAGDGGIGVSSSISGTAKFYAGGGGGGWTNGIGGNGGGGNTGVNGVANTGGGGGGASASTVGNGGSGIVIISYAGPQRATGGTVTSAGGNTVHTFTGSGTLVG